MINSSRKGAVSIIPLLYHLLPNSMFDVRPTTTSNQTETVTRLQPLSGASSHTKEPWLLVRSLLSRELVSPKITNSSDPEQNGLMYACVCLATHARGRFAARRRFRCEVPVSPLAARRQAWSFMNTHPRALDALRENHEFLTVGPLAVHWHGDVLSPPLPPWPISSNPKACGLGC